MGAEGECLILFFGGLGVCYLLACGWRLHGAKSYLGPLEIFPNVFGGCNNCLQHSGYGGGLPPQKFGLIPQRSQISSLLLPQN